MRYVVEVRREFTMPDARFPGAISLYVRTREDVDEEGLVRAVSAAVDALKPKRVRHKKGEAPPIDNPSSLPFFETLGTAFPFVREALASAALDRDQTHSAPLPRSAGACGAVRYVSWRRARAQASGPQAQGVGFGPGRFARRRGPRQAVRRVAERQAHGRTGRSSRGTGGQVLPLPGQGALCRGRTHPHPRHHDGQRGAVRRGGGVTCGANLRSLGMKPPRTAASSRHGARNARCRGAGMTMAAGIPDAR